jgi:hypothetical protein
MFVNYAPNYTPQTLAASQYSHGGAFAMSPVYTSINPAQQSSVASSGQGGGPNLLDLVSNGKDLVGSGTSSGTGILSNITSSINNFGAGLGFAPGTVTYPASSFAAVGPNLPGVVAYGPSAPVAQGLSAAVGTPVQGTGVLGTGFGSGATLSNVLGGAGFGALAGGFLGRIGGNETGGMIGGALGGALGAASGLSSGIAMGSTLGSIVPGLGTVIGAGIGGLVGGFFGGKKPATQSDEYRAMLTADGGQDSNGIYQGGKNAGSYGGFGKSVTSNLSSMLQKAHKELGIQFNPKIQIGGGISTLHGGSHLNVGFNRESDAEPIQGEQIFYDYNDPASYTDAMKKSLVWAAKLSGVEDLTKVEQWYDNTVSGKNAASSYNVPFKSKQNFDSFMNKFKAQDTVNANPTNTTTA